MVDIANLIRKSMQRMSLSTSIPILQSQLYYHISEERSDGVERFLELVSKQKTNEEKVNCLYEKLKKYDLLKDKFKLDAKNDVKAMKYKEKGNRYFGHGKFNKALRTYSKTILKAKSEELLALGYANRSAALFKLGLFEECLTDIERAFAHNYPEHLKPKLVARKSKSSELLRNRKTATKFYEEPPKIPLNQRNPTIQSASNCVEIRVDANSRRRVFATKDIEIGDVIAVETPFAAVIGDVYLYHCHECFNLCYNPIPCESCTQALYCSEACREIASAKYHKGECPILLSLLNLVGGNKNFYLAFKTTMSCHGEAPDEVFKLAENIDKKEITDDTLKLAMTAAFMYHLVKEHTKMFQVPNKDTAEKKFKDFLLTSLRLSNIQASGVDELCPEKDDEYGQMSQESVACAIYPFFGLFRHSCCPNVFPQHHGLKKILRAIRTIKKGQECFVSYGPHYIEQDKEDRQYRLYLQYHFMCKCRACRENWPQIDLEPCPISAAEDFFFLYEIRGANVEFAKRCIPKKVEQLKQLERFEPNPDLTLQQKMLLHCYDILGNKRLVQ